MSETKLLPCPFCGKTPKVTRRDVEPQGDTWYGRKEETFVLCDCGACLFEETFHEGFGVEERAIAAWNTRATDTRIHAAMREALEAIVSQGEPLRGDAELWSTWQTRVNAWKSARAALAKAGKP